VAEHRSVFYRFGFFVRVISRRVSYWETGTIAHTFQSGAMTQVFLLNPEADSTGP